MKLAILAIIACLCMSTVALADGYRGQTDYRKAFRTSLEQALEASRVESGKLENRLRGTSSPARRPILKDAIMIQNARIALLENHLSIFDDLSDAEIADIAVEIVPAAVSPKTPRQGGGPPPHAKGERKIKHQTQRSRSDSFWW